MNEERFLTICRRLMESPAVAYQEGRVSAVVTAICAEAGLAVETDAHGNRIVTLCTDPALAPLAMVAHMDHPGFELSVAEAGGLEGLFLGGVGDSYFKEGVPLRAFPGDVPCRLGRRLGGDLRFAIEGSPTPPPGLQFAVWDLPAFVLGEGRIVGRACDDLVGVAAALSVLWELKDLGARVNVSALITRAEEVGFHGTLLLAQSGRVSRDTLVVSLETSREMPPVQMGQGVIVRVGDRSSVFNSDATRFLTEVARGEQSLDPLFLFQRALMSGGSCEGTAFQEYGYRVAALCVALGNYHNCGADDRIQPEFVSVSDAVGMVRLLVAASLQSGSFETFARKPLERFTVMTAEALRRLI